MCPLAAGDINHMKLPSVVPCKWYVCGGACACIVCMCVCVCAYVCVHALVEAGG